MFRIGEFSKLTQVSIRMLRYYDEVGLLKPEQTDKMTDYRLYTANQIPHLNKIIFLRNLGFQISEIAEALKQWENSFLEKLLENKRLQIEDVIREQQSRLSEIDLAMKDIGQNKIAVNCGVSIKSIPSYQVLSLRRIVLDYYCEGQLWKEMSEYAKCNRLNISDKTFTIYHDADYKETDVDIEICSPVDTIVEGNLVFQFRKTEAVPIMACSLVYGSFENIAGTFLTFANWIQEHNQYRMAGGSRQIVHRGPWNEERVENYLTEIQIPLNKR